MRLRQAGVSLFVVAIALLLLIGIFVAALGFFRSGKDVASSSQAAASLNSAQSALEQFAGSTGRLPCPADPALDTGDSTPVGASAVCTFPQGTIPWKTIGLRRDDAYDPWGSKISYRVFQGSTGLTQTNGASMVQCDSAVPVGALNPGTTAEGLCYTAFGRHTAATAFLAGKGFAVNDFGNNVTGVAYVLISHGPSGLGGWPSGNTRRALPVDAAELANTTATGPFVAQAATAPSVDPMATPHFDDVLAYRTIADLAQRANLPARDWPDPAATTENVTLNTATVSAALGTAASYGDLGRQSLVLGNSTITAFNSGGNQNLSFDTSGSNEGVGGAGGGNGLSETGGEGVRVTLALKARMLGVTLNDFGYLPAGFPVWRERVQFRFIDTATLTTVNIVRQGCNADGGLASFATINPGFDFDVVEVRAMLSTPDPVLGTTIASAFFFSAFRTCAVGAASCSSALETAGNLCP